MGDYNWYNDPAIVAAVGKVGNRVGQQQSINRAVQTVSNTVAPPKPPVAPQQTDLAKYGMGGGMAGQAGSFTANVKGLGDNYAANQGNGLAQHNQRYLDALQNRKSQVAGLQFQRQANPYARGGELWNRTMDDASSRPSAGLQQALQNQQQSLAERGITADSGLTQQAGLQARNEAAKMAAQFGNQAALGLGQQGAQFDDAETQRQRAFDQFKANALDAFDTGNYGLIDRFSQFAADQERDQYGRRLDSQLDPMRVQEAQQGLQRGALLNAYQSSMNKRYDAMTPYELMQAQQGVDLGQFNLEQAKTSAPYQQQLLAGRVAEQGIGLEQLQRARDFDIQNSGLIDGTRRAQLMSGATNSFINQAMPQFQVLGQASQAVGPLARMFFGA